MKKGRNLKLSLAFITLMLGVLGISKSDLVNSTSLLNQEKLALSGNNSGKLCSPETMEETKGVKNVSLFVSCAGFLE